MNCKLSPSGIIFVYKRHRILLSVSVVSILLLTLIVAGCAASPSPAPTDIDTVDKGEYSGIETREQLIIKSQTEWQEFWNEHASVHASMPEFPEVNFSQEIVIAVFSGEKPSGGYSIEIIEISLAENQTTVLYEELSPRPEQLVTEALTQPFHIAKIDRIDDSLVEFLSEYSLEEEFILHIGESAAIAGEDLEIEFMEISEDSRCARDVTCIWEGRVTAIVEISMEGSSQQVTLTEPGLTDAPAREIYGEYEFIYKVEPYPEKAAIEIMADEYRLLLIISE